MVCGKMLYSKMCFDIHQAIHPALQLLEFCYEAVLQSLNFLTFLKFTTSIRDVEAAIFESLPLPPLDVIFA